MAKCKGCGADIIFIKTEGGKRMPCDKDAVTYWERKGAKGKIVTPNGEVISCDFSGNLDKATGMGYIPHWATCFFKRNGRNRESGIQASGRGKKVK